jgi:hypothetical protein
MISALEMLCTMVVIAWIIYDVREYQSIGTILILRIARPCV